MNLQQRIELLHRLGQYILSDEPAWLEAKHNAGLENPWFSLEFTERASKNIATHFLQKKILEEWTSHYKIPYENIFPRSVGVVMAGNIPLVGFHDFLCVFITGHHIRIKASSKDQLLIKHLVQKLTEWEASCSRLITLEDMLKGCDAYIATGSNNSSRYFEYYFARYPRIIRKNRTSVAILDGTETPGDLELLADDVNLYFGLGCRNVTKIYVPQGYDFIPLLSAFRKYDYLINHHRYKNNYDYNLAILILNNKFYMTNDSVLLVENPNLFSPISQLNYEFYSSREQLLGNLRQTEELQAIVGSGFTGFGQSQSPAINDYADGIDTMEFLCNLK
jgi:hypothetical protein